MGRRGGRWRDHRQVINAILWRLRTKAPWRDLPERYGPWKTAHERLRKWTADGTWDRILDELAVPEGGCVTGWIEQLAIDGEAIGRSRGGLSSKIHLAVDGRGLPIRTILTAAQAGDNPHLLPPLDPQSPAPRGIRFTCPERSDQIAHRSTKGSHGGRPRAFDADSYRQRNVAKRATYYRAELTIAAIILWLRIDPQDTTQDI